MVALFPALAGMATVMFTIWQQVSHRVVFKALQPKVTTLGPLLMVASLLLGAGEVPPSAKKMP